MQSLNKRIQFCSDYKNTLKKLKVYDQFKNREISVFEFMMKVNFLGGRSFNDLSQYPVFPWLTTEPAFNDDIEFTPS